MKSCIFLLVSLFFISGCGKSDESKNPPEIVTRDSDTVFNDIPGKHHLGRNSFNMNIVDLLENVRKAHSFLGILGEAGLRDTLETAGPFTVFVLSDAKLDQSDAENGGGSSSSDIEEGFSAEDVKKYIIKGEFNKASLADQPVTTTDLEGNSVTLRLEGDKLVINDEAYNTSEAFEAENGVVYELDKPLE